MSPRQLIDEEEHMYARVVRFTDVTAERISEIVAQVEERFATRYNFQSRL